MEKENFFKRKIVNEIRRVDENFSLSVLPIPIYRIDDICLEKGFRYTTKIKSCVEFSHSFFLSLRVQLLRLVQLRTVQHDTKTPVDFKAVGVFNILFLC